ncbi:MAG: hypothetical protein IPL32_09005 [Chloracidobacterium sp.]|nr:hypothetical protein [Chloracidobacterium sp.]
MKPDWRECPRGDLIGQWSAHYVTMNPKGHIAMNRRTYESLNEPKAFNLLFDKVNNRIGLKPTALAARNAFPVAKQGRHGGKLVRAYRMIQEFGIDLPETIRFHDIETNEDGILMLDMRTAKVSTRAQGQKKRGDKQARK